MKTDLVIIGAGISGLTTAYHAAEHGMKNVLVVDYQRDIGGFTRPYLGSPRFSREKYCVDRAKFLPYPILTQTTVVGFFPSEEGNHQLFLQSPTEQFSVECQKVVIATGSLEKPREMNRIVGTRPAGVMTPSMAASLLEKGYLPGKQIALFANGRIAHSVAYLLEKQQVSVHLLPSETTEILEIKGRSRLTSIVINRNGQNEELACDTLIFASGRIPSTFFLKGTPVARDRHQAVIVDDHGKTNLPNVYAVGSCTRLGDEQHQHSIDLAETVAHDIIA